MVRQAYGEFTAEMQRVVAKVVRQRLVCDLGAGSGAYADLLAEMGAAVIAVEKEPNVLKPTHERVLPVERYINTFPAGFCHDVVFLSWPVNHPVPGLLECLVPAKTVIYLGCNTGGTACGTPSLWRALTHRSVLAVVEHPRNTLIVYGAYQEQPRSAFLLPEERAGLAT